mmetsp:Transcript_47957/g.138063  ORF Transcript_47957/g.138063 Transcript_47957/m.138063 type:complete len:212 (+) Transcript_47957:1194-1829(+)
MPRRRRRSCRRTTSPWPTRPRRATSSRWPGTCAIVASASVGRPSAPRKTTRRWCRCGRSRSHGRRTPQRRRRRTPPRTTLRRRWRESSRRSRRPTPKTTSGCTRWLRPSGRTSPRRGRRSRRGRRRRQRSWSSSSSTTRASMPWPARHTFPLCAPRTLAMVRWQQSSRRSGSRRKTSLCRRRLGACPRARSETSRRRTACPRIGVCRSSTE